METILSAAHAFAVHCKRLTVTSRDIQSAVRSLYESPDYVSAGTAHITNFNSEPGLPKEERTRINRLAKEMRAAFREMDPPLKLSSGAPVYLIAVLDLLAARNQPADAKVTLEQILHAGRGSREAFRVRAELALARIASLAAYHSRRVTIKPADVLCAAKILFPELAFSDTQVELGKERKADLDVKRLEHMDGLFWTAAREDQRTDKKTPGCLLGVLDQLCAILPAN